MALKDLFSFLFQRSTGEDRVAAGVDRTGDLLVRVAVNDDLRQAGAEDRMDAVGCGGAAEVVGSGVAKQADEVERGVGWAVLHV